jgi:hypothetical protein
MKILIDTNILIHIEDPKELTQSLQELLSIIRENGHRVFVHPASVVDISKDPDETRKNITLSKLKGYPQLTAPTPDAEFLSIVGAGRTPNDIIDNQILFAIYKNAADFLVTEDYGLNSKAKKLTLEDRVLTIEQAATYLRGLHKRVTPVHTLLKNEMIYNIDINDPFFDDLKADYPGFVNWFQKISREGRKAWAHYDNSHLKAILLLKDEDEAVACEPPLPASKRLKICTLKSESGHKLGELLLKIAFQYCVNNKFDEIYLTHFRKPEDPLLFLIEQFGFKLVGKKPLSVGGGQIKYEEVWLKKFTPDDTTLPPLDFAKTYYPVYKDSDAVKKFVVPIRPEFHDRLFPDYQNRQMMLSEYTEVNAPGNAIKKAYLCHSKIKKLNPGDLLLFYRSRDQKLTSLGVVESAVVLKETEDIVRAVGKRTVYTYDEIKEMARKPVLVILFRHHFNLPLPLDLDTLRGLGILASAPQSIVEIDTAKYGKVKNECGIDERFTFH